MLTAYGRTSNAPTSHNVPAKSHSSSESCMPVALTSMADAVFRIGDKISISASDE